LVQDIDEGAGVVGVDVEGALETVFGIEGDGVLRVVMVEERV
jgi:hypothetical protein